MKATRSVEKTVRDIRRRTRKKYSSEEKIRIVLEGLRGEESIAELCRREGLNPNVYYGRSEEILEQREMINQNTIAMRKQIHYDKQLNQMS